MYDEMQRAGDVPQQSFEYLPLHNFEVFSIGKSGDFRVVRGGQACRAVASRPSIRKLCTDDADGIQEALAQF